MNTDIKILEKAQELWASPAELIKLWNELESKRRQEQLISEFVYGGPVADLGCGVGRYFDALFVEEGYMGYDVSPQMIQFARELHPKDADKFACVDIFNFQPDQSYNNLICIDVVHHTNQPVDAILRIMQLWKAVNYHFTLLVGDHREDLFNSTVVEFTDFLRLLIMHSCKMFGKSK